MFLTRMHLNPARRGTHFLLASPQRMHAAVMCAFPPDPQVDGPGGRVLWRVDRGENSAVTLYISSIGLPDLTHVAEQAGWPTTRNPWQSVDSSPLFSRLVADQEWAFRLTANPVHSVRTPDGGRGKRRGHVTVAQQQEWLLTRAGAWGFEIVDSSVSHPSDTKPVPRLAVHSRNQITFTRRTDGAGRPVTLSVATFDGALRITDPDLLRAALTHGVGRAKGYGCGLITLAPSR